MIVVIGRRIGIALETVTMIDAVIMTTEMVEEIGTVIAMEIVIRIEAESEIKVVGIQLTATIPADRTVGTMEEIEID